MTLNSFSQRRVDALAATLCAAFYSDFSEKPGGVFASLSRVNQGHWRRVARTALHTLGVEPAAKTEAEAIERLEAMTRE